MKHVRPDRAQDPREHPDLLGHLRVAASAFDPTAPWERIAPMVLPVLRRIHQPYPPDLAPLQIVVPPGVWTGFGIDFGPGFSHVTASQVAAWGVDPADLLAASLDNLRILTRDEPPRVDRFDFEDVEVIAVQGQGWGSALILAPDLLAPILGECPRTLLTPSRNALIALPDPVRYVTAALIWDAVADGAPDELDVPPLRWTGSIVTGSGDDLRGLPN